MIGMMITILFVSVVFVTALPTQSNVPDGVSLPENAIEVASGVFYLGHSKDVNGNDVKGYAFVKYSNPNGLVSSTSSINSSECYGLMGAKWTTKENYLVNPNNNWGLDKASIVSHHNADVSKWENVLTTPLEIIGVGTSTTKRLTADSRRPDGKNEVYFGNVKSPGAIAVTIVWATRFDVNNLGQIVEYDQVFDQNDYSWSLSGQAGRMDYDNIATHELGHSFGMDDLYDTSCSDQTMYGYADFGETNKQTLEVGDINGINVLY